MTTNERIARIKALEKFYQDNAVIIILRRAHLRYWVRREQNRHVQEVCKVENATIASILARTE